MGLQAILRYSETVTQTRSTRLSGPDISSQSVHKEAQPMDNTRQKPRPLVAVATFIVDKRNLFFLLYAISLIFCLFSRNWVSVNNDLTDYLPADTETRQGLSLMEEQFTTFGTARVMLSNVTYDEAAALAKDLASIEGITTVDFGDASSAESRAEHFRNSAALFDVTFAGEEQDSVSLQAMNDLRAALSGYDVSISSAVGQDDSASLAQEMQVILVIAAIIIITVLLLTSRTYGEVPVLLMTFVAAAVLNMGTNFLCGEISFVSNSIAVVLQLALAIDYAIIFCHRFSEERQSADTREACILALSKSIPEISSSCLTTLAGLIAMMFMQFRIGLDLGIVLVKAILFSILSVFTLMPGLLMLFSRAMDKTHHRNFIPPITLWGRFVTRLKWVVPPLFACALVAAFFLSNQCPYAYGFTLLKTEKKSETVLEQEKIDGAFGTQNLLAVLVPAGDYTREGQLLDALSARPDVDSALGLANVPVEGEEYVLTDQLTPRQFAELTDLDVEVGRLLYTAYATDQEEYGRILNNIDNYGVPLLDMFLFLHDRVEEGYVTLDDDLRSELDDLYQQVHDAQLQLQGSDYSRLLVTLNLPEEGEETFACLDELHTLVRQYYPEGCYLVGESTSDYDLSTSFQHDNVLVSVLSVLFVIVVLLFTFQSVGMPLLLILVIQGSVWINFAVPTLQHSYIFFLSYLIVSSIQMGANIDYAIVISSRYQELKTSRPPREAMIETLNLAFPTVFTSGSIMASAGILISKLTSNEAIYGVGLCLGRGTIISMALVLGVLPEILLLGDTIIEKTAFNLKYPALVHTVGASGKVYLDGRVRGTISGHIDAEVHGVLDGEVSAVVTVHQADPIQSEQEEAHETQT